MKIGNGQNNEVLDCPGKLLIIPKGNYRKIAQQNWNLTDKQMKGMHVHHRIPQSEGGTNDPANLYVCSPYFHAYAWHTESYFTLNAHKGGHSRKGIEGKRKGGRSNSPAAVANRAAPASAKQKEAVRKTGLGNRGKKYKTTHNNQAAVTNSQKWECLVTGKVLPPGPLSHWQKNRGIDTSQRRKVS